MEDLKKAAKYYLETAPEEYKKQAQKAMDRGENLKDFYVRETKRCIRCCNVCTKHLVGFYMCCTKCELFKGCNYNLCVQCFYGRTFQHNHDTFADNHSVMMMLNEGRCKPSCVIEKNNGKGKQVSNSSNASSSHSKPISNSISNASSSHSKPTRHDSSLKNSSSTNSGQMIIPNRNFRESSHPKSISNASVRAIKIGEYSIKRLAQIANAHYNASPDYIRANADKFFWSMVKQEGNIRVTMEDFLKFMKEKGYSEYAYPELFKMVVKDRKKGMEISESRTIYYIVVSATPFCSWCRYIIPDIYFCCSKCSARSYALCLNCYSNKAYLMHKHYGDDDAFFLDYTLLHNTIKATSKPSGNSGSPPGAIVRANPHVRAAIGVGRAITAILNIGVAVMSISSACTIM